MFPETRSETSGDHFLGLKVGLGFELALHDIPDFGTEEIHISTDFA
jgi:hypothetical protein